MSSAKKAKQPRPYLSTNCECGHTYNWHVPGDVCQVPKCACKKHVTRDESPKAPQ
ncbi:hypothetical protein GCM10010317_077120 [Streptomyces mirabilis]|uniref:hypothetical protein n=1 Tax=Streptomyces mirabilis TaxID=68239 RepID=UPI00167EC948|nr:hypothetical protein [Streptomyces mirabilis]GHD70237.1 hypothetical protein GCM10010317_077120 [Streptomyces mirabilis]